MYQNESSGLKREVKHIFTSMVHEIKRAFKNATVESEDYGVFDITPLVIQYDKEARDLFDGQELDKEDQQDLAITKKKRIEPTNTSLQLYSLDSKVSSGSEKGSLESEDSEDEDSEVEDDEQTKQEEKGKIKQENK